MKRLIAITLICTVWFGIAAANTHTQLDKGPGMIGADSPLYGLETAMDNAAVSIGLAKAGGIAQERAAEAQAAQDKGDNKAAEKAANQMSKVAQKAKDRDLEGLQKAEAVLNEVRANAPEEAQDGLQTALSNVQQARERAQQAREQAGSQAPDDTGQAPGDTPTGGDQVPEDAQQRIAEAEQLREDGRQEIDQGNADLDAGNYAQAEQHFQQAEQYFQQAENKVAGLDATGAQQLRTQLERSKSGAMNLVESVQAYQDGDNATAEQYANQAQQDFQQARGGQ